MRLVAYLRVSTDDKGQDPSRQKAPILARATKDGHEVVAWVIDEGTSGAVPAMERPRVQEAIKLAKSLGARALVVEAVDRWSRGGWQDVGVSMYQLESDHGLGLLFADLQGDDFVVELLTGILATIAKMNRKRLAEMTRTGMANARAKGVRLGRPAKPDLTAEELAVVVELVKSGRGLRRAADAITATRMVGRDGVPVVDAKARRFRKVSASWLADQLAKRPETPGLLGRVIRPCHRDPPPNGSISTRGVPA